ncbi:hypothetical protein BH24DEI2_BH24DEI2_27020 [soil metagenome]
MDDKNTNDNQTVRPEDAPFGSGNAQGSSKVSAQDAVSEVAADARHKTEEVFKDAKVQLQEVGSALQDQALNALERHRGDVAEQIGTIAETLRHGGEELRKQKLPGIAHYADSAADAVVDVTTYLRERDGAAMLQDVERAAKRQPLFLYGGLFALGALGVWVFRAAGDTSSAVPSNIPSNPSAQEAAR